MRLAFVFFLLVVQSAQPSEQYPGQRQHKEPPAGYFCAPNGDKAHVCHCKRMMHATPDDPVCEFGEAPESPQCSVWCYKDRCRCPVACEMPGHHSAPDTSPGPR